MYRGVVGLCAAAAMAGQAFAATDSNDIWHPTPADFSEWVGASSKLEVKQGADLGAMFGGVYSKLMAWAADYLNEPNLGDRAVAGDNEYPYFGIIPFYEGSIVPGGAPITWQAGCFGQMTGSASTVVDGKFTITLDARKPSSLLCSDQYMFATVEGLKLHTNMFHGTHTLTWSVASDARDAEAWDVANKGVRVFRFRTGWTQVVSDLVESALLFEPLLTKAPSAKASARNLDFLNKYSGFHMDEFVGAPVALDESAVQSGDFIGIVRLDGLDPMLAWAMGSTTGHTTVALWEGGQLYICESTTTSSYWPTNGVQKTPFKTWIAQAQAAGHNAVHLPLRADLRAKFNASAAFDFFSTVEGFDYGYYTLLWGWIDTVDQNYPCLPPTFDMQSGCLSWDIVEPLFGLADRLVPSVGELLYNQAFNHRLGTSGLRTPELYQHAVAVAGREMREVPTQVEQDDWVYNTTRFGQPAVGRSQVCCVFVCNMWKAGGLFAELDNEVNCGELTNWDDYALDMFDIAAPAECAQPGDTEPSLCQVSGPYRLQLNNLNSKKPFAHMAESCPSMAPKYDKPADC